MRYARLILAAPVLVMVPAAAQAQQETRTSVDVAGTAGYSNNPFAVSGDDTGAAYVALDVLPRLVVVGPQSTLSVSGAVRLQQYVRRYSSNDSYSGAIDYTVRASERLTAHARLEASSAVTGGNDSYIPGLNAPALPFLPGSPVTGPATGPGTGPDTGVGVIDPGLALPLPALNDISIYGLRDRRRFARLSGDVSTRLSEHDSLTVSGFGELSRYGRVAFGDYEGYGGTIGYSRQVTESANVGVRGSATMYDYDGVNTDTTIYSVEGTANLRLSESWSLDGALGVSFVNGDGPGSTGRTSLSGDVSACQRRTRSTMCFFAARRVSATGLVGSQYVTTAGANWGLKLSERENVSVNGSYSQVGTDNREPVQAGQQFANQFVRLAAGYDRRLTERLRFVSSVNVRQLFGSQDDRPLDYGGQVGVSVRLGDPR